MKDFLKHPLFLSVLTIAAIYVGFAYVMFPPPPKSLLIQYMVICVVGVLLVASFDDATATKFARPFVVLLGAPGMGAARAAAMIVLALGTGWITYSFVKPSATAPLELRTVHPAPPSTLRVYDKTYDLLTLENPLRAQFPEGSEGFAEVVAEGAELYYKGCIFCHGDRLDGKGQFSEAFNPRPANFQNVATIAQLQESYLFWRITTGGPGLPREGTPWASAMPVWHEMLDEDEVWKIITFLYDYTGFVPRSWELDEPVEDASIGETAPAGGVLDEAAVDRIYAKSCAQCHGVDGDGEGPAADLFYPRPRDFTLALFKYKTTDADSEFPTDDDFRRTIRNGLTGTAMPGWSGLLNDAEIDAMIDKVKRFGEWEEEEEEIEYTPIAMGTRPEVTPDLLAEGRRQFVKTCAQCHGDTGRGNITSGKPLKDDLQNRIWPRNLTRPESWRYTSSAADVYQRLSTGIPGTPMPEHATTMSEDERWAIASYVMTLRDDATPLRSGETVIRAVRVSGDLPGDPGDTAWDAAPAMSFALAPNIIREPRKFTLLNDTVTVRALYNDTYIAFRLDVDDRTYSVPGDELEARYALGGVTATRDAIAIQLPARLSGTSEKPAFRHGDAQNPVSMWYWAAPSVAPQSPKIVMVLDADGPDKAPVPRADTAGLTAQGQWRDGRWQVVFQRPRDTGQPADLVLEEGVYVPIAFSNWDGLAGDKSGRHSFTSWYWVLLEPVQNQMRLYGLPIGAGGLAGLGFLLLSLRQRRSFVS